MWIRWCKPSSLHLKRHRPSKLEPLEKVFLIYKQLVQLQSATRREGGTIKSIEADQKHSLFIYCELVRADLH